MNTELFRKINEVIAPAGVIAWDVFNMGTWEGVNASCGTTRCVAGWAIHLTTGQPLFADEFKMHSSVTDLADRVGARRYAEGMVDFEDLAAGLLGLGIYERSLFYADEETASEFVALAAEGREDEAREVLER